MYLVAIAVAIAIHNIPEGIATSVPIYYSTGSRKRAFMVSFFSGITEPLGAIIGYFNFTSVFQRCRIRYFIRNNRRNYGIYFNRRTFTDGTWIWKKQSHYYRRHTRYGNNSAQLTFISINFTQYINNSYFKKYIL